MCCRTRKQQLPSRQRSRAAFLAASLIAASAVICLVRSSTPRSGADNNPWARRLWDQNIYWAGNPNIVPPPPPPPPPPKPPAHNYRPPASAPGPSNPRPPGNPFEKPSSGGSGTSSSNARPSSTYVAASPPKSPPTPSYPAAPHSSPSASYIVSSAVSQQGSSNARPQSQQAASAISQEQPAELQPAQAFTAESPSQSTPQVSQNTVESSSATTTATTTTKTTTITSAMEITGIPSVIPPYGSMERMALLNLLVHKIESSIAAVSQEKVSQITILAIGSTSMLSSRLLRSAHTVDRALASSAQLVKYSAALEHDCAQQDEETCAENAQASANEILRQLEPATPSGTPSSSENSVDNQGEDWSGITNANDNELTQPSQAFVWLPSPSSNGDLQVVASRPTPYPASPPLSSSTVATAPQTFHNDIQSFTSKPTMQPTSDKSSSTTAVSMEDTFQGDASKRYCGYDWDDVVRNCLTATPCPEGHAEGVCPYGMSCFADTPCDEVRQEQEVTQQEQLEQTPQGIETMMSGSSSSSLDSHDNNNNNTAIASCSSHNDCHNQFCADSSSGSVGTCVDCLFNSNIGCRASEVCIASSTTGMPQCQGKPTVIESHDEAVVVGPEEEDTGVMQSTVAPQPLYQNPQDNSFFCGLTYADITDMCLHSKPCPTGVAAIHCGEKEGCFSHPTCKLQYDAIPATGEPSSGSGDTMSAFAAFDSTEMERNPFSQEEQEQAPGEGKGDMTSFWTVTLWNSARTSSLCAVSLWTVVFSGILLMLL